MVLCLFFNSDVAYISSLLSLDKFLFSLKPLKEMN